jgi:predicted GIY-YIG superfamily endonuclease
MEKGRLAHPFKQNLDCVIPKCPALSLAYYEEFTYPDAAIAREKEIKGWRRSKKVRLVESMNPRWNWLRIGRMCISLRGEVPPLMRLGTLEKSVQIGVNPWRKRARSLAPQFCILISNFRLSLSLHP